jgi:hypothetical protein
MSNKRTINVRVWFSHRTAVRSIEYVTHGVRLQAAVNGGFRRYPEAVSVEAEYKES